MKYCYAMYISQFEVHDDLSVSNSRKDGFHRHHIVPRSEQKKAFGEVVDNRQVYLTPAEHLWSHILYDRMTGLNTSKFLVGLTDKRKEDFHSYEDCLILDKVDREYREKMSIENKGEKNPNYGNHVLAGENNPFYGKTHSDETKNKIGEIHKGNQYMLGHHHTEETKRKLSEWNKEHPNQYWLGKHLSDETKKKLSESHKGKPGTMKGKHHTDEAKRKVSEANKGRKRSEENKRNQSIRQIGCHWYNDGTNEVFTKECPEGFVKGRLSSVMTRIGEKHRKVK